MRPVGTDSTPAVRKLVADGISEAKRQALGDLRTDPILRYVLLLSAVLSTFGIWHSLPNFATRDERWRVVDPIEPLGFVLADPSVAALRDGVVFWRPYGATMYLFGLTAYLAGLSPNEFLFDTLLFAVFSGAVAVPLVPVLVTAIALTGPGLGPSGVLAVGGGLLAAVGYGLTRRAGPRWERKLTTG